jgi:hypothetical protein
MLAATIIIIFIVVLAIVFPGFRNFLLVVLVLGGAAIFYFTQKENRASELRQKAQATAERIAYSAITANDLALSDVSLKYFALDYWTLEGLVTNNSKHSLLSMTFQVTMKDCEDKAKPYTCRIVGQATQPAHVEVPPAQTRSFQTYSLEFRNMPKEVLRFCQSPPCNPGRIFEYQLAAIRAYVP